MICTLCTLGTLRSIFLKELISQKKDQTLESPELCCEGWRQGHNENESKCEDWPRHMRSWADWDHSAKGLNAILSALDFAVF